MQATGAIVRCRVTVTLLAVVVAAAFSTASCGDGDSGSSTESDPSAATTTRAPTTTQVPIDSTTDTTTGRSADGSVPPPDAGQRDPLSLEVGECVRDRMGGGPVTEVVVVVDCEEPHAFEVTFTGVEALSADATGGAIDAWGQGICRPEMEAYTGVSIDQHLYDATYFTTLDPMGEATAGDYPIICLVVPFDRSITTGSVRG